MTVQSSPHSNKIKIAIRAAGPFTLAGQLELRLKMAVSRVGEITLSLLARAVKLNIVKAPLFRLRTLQRDKPREFQPKK
jgi:hypothetical protein